VRWAGSPGAGSRCPFAAQTWPCTSALSRSRSSSLRRRLRGVVARRKRDEDRGYREQRLPGGGGARQPSEPAVDRASVEQRRYRTGGGPRDGALDGVRDPQPPPGEMYGGDRPHLSCLAIARGYPSAKPALAPVPGVQPAAHELVLEQNPHGRARAQRITRSHALVMTTSRLPVPAYAS
jgi:hypothetical protein